MGNSNFGSLTFPPYPIATSSLISELVVYSSI